MIAMGKKGSKAAQEAGSPELATANTPDVKTANSTTTFGDAVPEYGKHDRANAKSKSGQPSSGKFDPQDFYPDGFVPISRYK
jgi:hypothetical protein